MHCYLDLHSCCQLNRFLHQVFVQGGGATERSHRVLNTAPGIFCEQQQKQWEQFLQPAVYAHNVSPIFGTTNINPFFSVFGRDALSPETMALHLPVHPLPCRPV